MKITKQPGGSLELEMSSEELGWLHQTLNECCNGIRIKDFNATIGTNSTVLQHMLNQIGGMFDAPVGHEG